MYLTLCLLLGYYSCPLLCHILLYLQSPLCQLSKYSCIQVVLSDADDCVCV